MTLLCGGVPAQPNRRAPGRFRRFPKPGRKGIPCLCPKAWPDAGGISAAVPFDPFRREPSSLPRSVLDCLSDGPPVSGDSAGECSGPLWRSGGNRRSVSAGEKWQKMRSAGRWGVALPACWRLLPPLPDVPIPYRVRAQPGVSRFGLTVPMDRTPAVAGAMDMHLKQTDAMKTVRLSTMNHPKDRRLLPTPSIASTSPAERFLWGIKCLTAWNGKTMRFPFLSAV